MDARAIIFVPALAGSIIVGFVFSLFAANYYLTVLQSTSSGAKCVVWVNEPILDSFWKVFYMAWLIGLWLGPAWFLGRAFASGPDHAWMRYAIPLLVFWICFPVSQLSSLSGPGLWLPLHHEVFARLASKPEMIPGFLLVSGIDLAFLGLGFHWTFNAEGLIWLFAGAPLFVAAILYYARFLGRFAFALIFTRSILARKRRKRPEQADSPPERRPREESLEASLDEIAPVDFIQPSELPPIQTPDEGPITGYNFASESTPPPQKRIRAELASDSGVEKSGVPEPPPRSAHPASTEDDEEMPCHVNEPEVAPEQRAPIELVKPSEVEMRLLNRDDAPKRPKQLWTPEVFAFLFQPDATAVWGLLTLLCLMTGGMIRVAKEFNPASSGP